MYRVKRCWIYFQWGHRMRFCQVKYLWSRDGYIECFLCCAFQSECRVSTCRQMHIWSSVVAGRRQLSLSTWEWFWAVVCEWTISCVNICWSRVHNTRSEQTSQYTVCKCSHLKGITCISLLKLFTWNTLHCAVSCSYGVVLGVIV